MSVYAPRRASVDHRPSTAAHVLPPSQTTPPHLPTLLRYSGNLHDQAYPSMVHDAETADLVLVIGTSLGGLNADQVASSTAERSLIPLPYMADGAGGALGTVCINLQQTVEDGKMTLRLFGKSDDILTRVVDILKIGPIPTTSPKWPKARALVPYDADGRRLPPKDTETPHMWLDLRRGRKVSMRKHA